MNSVPTPYDVWLLKSRYYGAKTRSAGASEPDVYVYPERWRDFDQIAADQDYAKTFRFEGPYATERHQQIANAPMGMFGMDFLIDLGVKGYLRMGDALKIYELAHFAPGDVLELGTHQGLSTSIIASALEDRGHGRLETVDIDAGTNALARANLAGRPGAERITFTLKDATTRLDELIVSRAQYGFIFVDHWHSYDLTRDAAERAKMLLAPGGFVLFHDYDDPTNFDPAHVHGVYQAALDAFADHGGFVFCGNFGCVGLFRRSIAA